MRWTLRLWAAVVASLALILALPAEAQVIRVGSKNFTEQFIVAELYAAALEGAGFKVERKINLGATLVAQEALRTGAIDVYPEYTGTALIAVLKMNDIKETDPTKVFDVVRTGYEKQFDLTWLKPSGVNNGNAMVVRPETAQKYNLKTLSDLAKVAGELTIGMGSEFADRYDGLPGMKAVYGIQFKDSRQFAALRLRYDALAQKQVDMANGFSTDWQIAADKFVALDDDKHLFPPYFLAPVVRRDLAKNDKAVDAIGRVDAMIDNSTMQELNRQVEVDKKEPRRVAADFLKSKGLLH